MASERCRHVPVHQQTAVVDIRTSQRCFQCCIHQSIVEFSDISDGLTPLRQWRWCRSVVEHLGQAVEGPVDDKVALCEVLRIVRLGEGVEAAQWHNHDLVLAVPGEEVAADGVALAPAELPFRLMVLWPLKCVVASY
ncbi:hypothetical protein [Rhodococcus globerulus]|uniref:Uncharacterized protein n=1 Tax=Rhodococcus globerulus TaxID=33008 RepID=A0ABU4C418_RHOGO|nr:hypothetical protein [Rhodococcus globerulus]MDV6271128.1 hypothetical protein [Rhodococcus globerulus]